MAERPQATVVTLAAGREGRKPRFEPPKTRQTIANRWQKLKRRLHGSMLDSSIGDPTNTSDGGSFRRQFSRTEQALGDGEKQDEDGEVDVVVVQRDVPYALWGQQNGQHSPSSEHGGAATATAHHDKTHQSESSFRGTSAYEDVGFFTASVSYFRWRLYPLVKGFFFLPYHDAKMEEAFQREEWGTSKSTALFGACFIVLSWVLGVAVLPRPFSLWNKVYFYGLSPFLAVPLIPLAAFDAPRQHWWLWQTWVFCTVCIGTFSNIIDMTLCDYFIPALKHCGTKDFQGTMYFVTAFPTIGLFALQQARLSVAINTVLWIVVVAIKILPHRPSYVRNWINALIFLSFIIFIHYRRELAERRMYTMRAELKIQYRATQRAQQQERKVMDANKRFSSYIFHEIRVPLNTLKLAVQNLVANGAFDGAGDDDVEYGALQSSISMMTQVVDDVLDLGRLEKGAFSSVSRPFSFHNVMRSIIVPLQLDATKRGLHLETYLDPRIDEVAKKASSGGLADDLIVQEGDGVVAGDEMRLRQIINNLASNAAKFTPTGGAITVRTTLVHPTSTDDLASQQSTPQLVDGFGADPTALSTTQLERLDGAAEEQSAPATGKRTMIIRIEVEDTGVGIRPKDMTESRLFSAYVQTDIGRQQGGKGTGLGLSLVRQIVMMTGGQLGLRSKVGKGSTFYLELPFIYGPSVVALDSPAPNRRGSSAGIQLNPAYHHPPDSSTGVPAPKEVGKRMDTVIDMPTQKPEFGYMLTSPPTSPSIGQTESIPSSFSPTSPSTLAVGITASAMDPPAVSPASASSEEPQGVRPQVVHSISAPSKTMRTKSKALEFADGPLRVLVVEDDALTRRLMGRMMERLGCIVSLAEDGQMGLEMLTALPEDDSRVILPGVDPRAGDAPQAYDITFADNQMPRMSGPELVSRLRALARDDLVYGVTANAQASEQERFLRMGASAVLTKPVMEDSLRAALVVADQDRRDRLMGSSGSATTTTPKPSRPAAVFRTDSYPTPT